MPTIAAIYIFALQVSLSAQCDQYSRVLVTQLISMLFIRGRERTELMMSRCLCDLPSRVCHVRYTNLHYIHVIGGFRRTYTIPLSMAEFRTGGIPHTRRNCIPAELSVGGNISEYRLHSRDFAI